MWNEVISLAYDDILSRTPFLMGDQDLNRPCFTPEIRIILIPFRRPLSRVPLFTVPQLTGYRSEA